MSELKFEGNLEGLHEVQLEFIRSVLENRGYKNETVQVLAVGKADDNFIANVKRFVVEKDGETFKMIGKIAPNLEIIRKNMKVKILFYNEHVMYTEVLPKFTELEIAAGISESERLKYAGYYGSSIAEPYEVILLEDLQLSNFTILDKTVSLTDETVRMILKNFALLHSYSYVLKHQESETFEAFKSKLVNMWVDGRDDPDLLVYFEQLENDIMPLFDEHKQKYIKGNLKDIPQNAVSNLTANDPKYTVIIQGDPWTNNIMFNVENGVPVNSCIIDYQLSSENSPASDLEYMIFNCTDYDTRSKYYPQWINYYYKELDKSLSRFGLRIEEVYPREQLDAELKRFGRQFLGITVMMASVLMRETAETANIKEALAGSDPEVIMEISKIENMEKSSLVRFTNRIDKLVDSFIELGYVDE